VINVASQCGFLNPGHFARDYRIAFGELPSETLRQSRRGENFSGMASKAEPADPRASGSDWPQRKRPNGPLIPSC
jgi:AraC-like DNA-binding protein